MEILSKRGEKKDRKKECRVHNYEGEREEGEGTGPRGSTRLANHSSGAAWHILRHLTSNGHSVKDYFLSIHSLPDTVVSASNGLP